METDSAAKLTLRARRDFSLRPCIHHPITRECSSHNICCRNKICMNFLILLHPFWHSANDVYLWSKFYFQYLVSNNLVFYIIVPSIIEAIYSSLTAFCIPDFCFLDTLRLLKLKLTWFYVIALQTEQLLLKKFHVLFHLYHFTSIL